MLADVIANAFTPDGFITLMGWLIIALIAVYTFIAFVITRQVKLMNSSFKTSAAFTFALLANIHFLFSLGLLIVSIIIL